uniref:Uncharacterized protein n=1 Tax=Timema genevievae TaxID=629358 RepID=A0A7R9JZK2_TIMGE|nr:unnamed protein product [Timema genevievae]
MIGLTAEILVLKDSSCQKERNHFNLESLARSVWPPPQKYLFVAFCLSKLIGMSNVGENVHLQVPIASQENSEQEPSET